MRPARLTRCTPRPFVSLLLLYLLLLGAAQADARPGGGRKAAGGLVSLDAGWEYRWGDSPLDAAGVPVWTYERDESWRPADRPSNPPGRAGRTNLWLRLRLPPGQVRDPRLFITSIDLVAEVYLDGERIYTFGRFDENGSGRFGGWPWHLIVLPESYGGRQLHFRLFSDYRDIGLRGDVLLGSGFDHLRRMQGRDTIRLAVAVISLAISLIFLLLYLFRRDQRSSLYLALVARVASQTQLQQLLFAAPVVIDQSLEHKVAERTQQLELANRRLREEKVTLEISSITDGLTGLYNRTYVLDRFEKELAASRRYDKLLSVIMFDLDHFKRVNDAYGHQVGDAVMQRVTAIFKAVIRESDLAGRYGGEEFLIVLPETDCGEAAVVAERIRAQVEALQWTEPGLRPTISGGVAESSGETADRLLQRADSLLYRAKELGRNRVISQAEAYPRLVDRAT